MDETQTTQFRVDEALAGERLDAALTALSARTAPSPLSRSRAQALIADGRVALDGAVETRAKRKVADGSVIVVDWPEPEPATPLPQAIALDVLYEDAALIVVDKPAGLVVHPGAGNPDGTLVNALLHHCGDSLSGIGGVRRPGIVHRLDRDTSGVMVVAKTDAAHKALAAQFAAHGRDGRLDRAYRAIVWGTPHPSRGTIDAPLGRSESDRTRRAVVPAGRPDARAARTRYEVERTTPDAIAALLRCRLETGRTHQIRVHCAHIGHPLMADPLYGAGFRTKLVKLAPEAAALAASLGRQALHAYRLAFAHPDDDRAMAFESPLPADLRALAAALGLVD